MARSANLTLTNWQTTGLNRQVAQRTMQVTWNWVDDSGVAQTYTRLFAFPDDFALLPPAWVSEQLRRLVVEATRKHAGIDG